MAEAVSERFDLARFVRAQAGIYPRALAELREGRKTSHWMWFVFPQILGLGKSANARFFAISGADEAKAYLDHELLGPRLVQSTQTVLGWAGERSAMQIFGPIDALKFHSSMTLFDAVAQDPALFTSALDAFYHGKKDRETLNRLEPQ